MRRWQAACVLLAAASLGVTAEDVPREVLLLARLKDRLRNDLTRLQDHTCLVTLTRFHKPPKARAGMTFLDTVRLEVLFSGKHEFYASPGDRRFVQDNPVGFTSSGLSGTGLFGLHLRSILGNAGTSFTYAGEQEMEGRTAVRYDFRLPAYLSGYKVSVFGGSATVGTAGSIWADRQSLDLLHMEVRGIEIPPGIPVEETISQVSYANVRLDGRGGKEVRLPQSGELYMRESSGEENLNIVDFTHCRSFGTESTLKFDAQPASTAHGRSVPSSDPDVSVPSLLLVTTQLITPIGEPDAVGAPIKGTVRGAVRHRGSVIIPDGSRVRGRIRRLERVAETPGYLAVGLEFTEMEVNGTAMRFYADLHRMDRAGAIDVTLSRRRVQHTARGARIGLEKLTLPELPGVASFFVRENQLGLLQNVRMVWRTRSLLR